MQRALKMLPEARESYRARLAIMVTLTEQDPENTGWQRDLSVSYAKVGDVQVADGQFAEAAQSYQQSLSILESLIKREPENAQWQEDLVLTYDRIGETAQRQQQWDAAAKAFGQSIELSRAHLNQQEVSPNWVRDFTLDAGWRWETLRDAPADSVAIDRAAALADLRMAQGELKKLGEAGKLPPAMEKNVAWIDKLIQDSEKR
jgi:tetratricopeptide (TPR) repeat protein